MQLRARLPARDDEAAGLLAAAVSEFLDSLRGPWRLRLTGLPLGDPTAKELAAAFPTGELANARSIRLVDDLDAAVTGVVRSRDPRAFERALPQVLAAESDRHARGFLRATARLHASIGQLEVATVRDAGGEPGGVLLTLVDGADRWPWWATPGAAGVHSERGAPIVTLTARRNLWTAR